MWSIIWAICGSRRRRISLRDSTPVRSCPVIFAINCVSRNGRPAAACNPDLSLERVAGTLTDSCSYTTSANHARCLSTLVAAV